MRKKIVNRCDDTSVDDSPFCNCDRNNMTSTHAIGIALEESEPSQNSVALVNWLVLLPIAATTKPGRVVGAVCHRLVSSEPVLVLLSKAVMEKPLSWRVRKGSVFTWVFLEKKNKEGVFLQRSGVEIAPLYFKHAYLCHLTQYWSCLENLMLHSFTN